MNLKVLLVSNQVRGIDGSGGLGDVAYALPKALAERQDVEIRVLTPGFIHISGKGLEDRFDHVVVHHLAVPLGGENIPVEVCEYNLPGETPHQPVIVCYLLKAALFEKADDSPLQAILLCRAAVEFLRFFEGFRPDVIHCNDWHTGLIPVYLSTLYAADPYLSRIATLYTTHNSGYGYQGAFPSQDVPAPSQAELLRQAALTEDLFVPQLTRSLEHQTLFNFSKGGFGFADLINTVSLTYAREIQTPAFGGGFDGLLRERSHDLGGIVDGIDIGEWDPGSDPYLQPENYSAANTSTQIQSRKRAIRSLLRAWQTNEHLSPFGDILPDSIVISMVGRIAYQKFPIVLPVLEEICQLPDVQVAILGSAHSLDHQGQAYAKEVRRLAAKMRNRLLFYEGFNIPLSHLVYASADILLMPSIYEPCGLSQMIAMRYGTVPVVRAVGGLEDTVVDEVAGPHANGYKFKEPSSDPQAMADIPAAVDLLLETTRRAILTCRDNPARWGELIHNGMVRDFSWSIPASQYVKLYLETVNRRVKSHFLL